MSEHLLTDFSLTRRIRFKKHKPAEKKESPGYAMSTQRKSEAAQQYQIMLLTLIYRLSAALT